MRTHKCAHIQFVQFGVDRTYHSQLIRMVLAKKFIVLKQFEDTPRDTDVELITEELPSIKEGGEHLKIIKN